MSRITFLRLARYLIGSVLGLGWIKRHAIDRLMIRLQALPGDNDGHINDLCAAYLYGAAQPIGEIVLAWDNGEILAYERFFNPGSLHCEDIYTYDLIGTSWAPKSVFLSQRVCSPDECEGQYHR